jgi:hypothetical protein
MLDLPETHVFEDYGDTTWAGAGCLGSQILYLGFPLKRASMTPVQNSGAFIPEPLSLEREPNRHCCC